MLGIVFLILALSGGIGVFIMADSSFKWFGLVPIGLGARRV